MGINGPDFIVPDREVSYERIPTILSERHPEFLDSDEYKTIRENEWEDLPGVVLAAFGKYLLRLARESDQTTAQHAFSLLEWLVTANQPDVTTSIVVEIFEVLDEPPSTPTVFLGLLGERSRALYDESCKP